MQEIERENAKQEQETNVAIAKIEHKDEGYIELVLRVLAGMCDGQNTPLQVLSFECFIFAILFHSKILHNKSASSLSKQVYNG